MEMYLLLFVAGVTIGALVAWAVTRSRTAAAVAVAETRLQGSQSETLSLKQQVDSLHGQLRAADKDRASLQTQLSQSQDGLAEQRATFKALAADALRENAEGFLTLANQRFATLRQEATGELEQKRQAVNSLVEPLADALRDIDKTVQEVRTLNQQLSTDANQLTRALTGSTKMQGDWGEVMLERILEKSGLRKNQDYFVQQTFKNSAGDNLRPDVLIKLPESKSLIVDSKVSLISYKEYANVEDDEVRAQALSGFLDSVRRHVKGLAGKSYEDLQGLKSPDFVIMFVPHEAAFMLAVSTDEQLWEEAYRNGVLLVSPTTLLFVLRTVAQLWKGEAQRQNVAEIANRGAELYDKFVGFVEDLKRVGAGIEQTKAIYDDAYRKLATGKGNVIRQAEMLRALGVKSKKDLPPGLVESASQEELDIIEGKAEKKELDED